MEVHLPCPPLHDWFPVLLADQRVGAWCPKQAPRRVRSTLGQWPILEAQAEGAAPAEALVQLDALIFGVRLERPAPPEDCLQHLRAGARIVELAVPRPRLLRGLLGLDLRPLARAQASQSRALQWLARGYFELEQWESVDPEGVIVTVARAR